jgi:hypothetical protein
VILPDTFIEKILDEFVDEFKTFIDNFSIWPKIMSCTFRHPHAVDRVSNDSRVIPAPDIFVDIFSIAFFREGVVVKILPSFYCPASPVRRSQGGDAAVTIRMKVWRPADQARNSDDWVVVRNNVNTKLWAGRSSTWSSC